MDKSVFMNWWFYFDLEHYLIQIMYCTLRKKNLCTLWSLTLAKKSCNSINNSQRASFQTMLFLVTMFKSNPFFLYHQRFKTKIQIS